MHFIKQHAKCLILLSVLLAGIIISAPYVRFQEFLSQGDHGRDLYAAQAVYRGELPYKDFWWVYGPLMPYYYGLFYKIFGIHISSIILGKLLLKILGGVLICLAMTEISSLSAAFLTACWFMLFAQDFFFTYNHLGGIVVILGIVFCLLSYIQNLRLKFAWGALTLVFLLCLIKINFGLAALAMCVITVAVCDFVRKLTFNTTKKLFYALGLIGLPLLVYGIYWSLLKNLSVTEIRQCLPYMEGDQPYSTSPWLAIINFLKITFRTATSNWPNLTFAVLINASGLRCLYLFAKNKLAPTRKITLGLSLGMLCLFYVFNFHEFLKSGVWYRAFWAQPLSMMISFVLIDTAAQSIHKIMRRMIFFCIAILIAFSWWSVLPHLNTLKTEGQYLNLPRGDIYLTNSPAWIATVRETTDFLNKTLKPDELFFALPYDCLYYFLTDKKTPTRQLIFFEHIKIPTAQEKSVIADLERNHVNYVVLSSRAYVRQELGLGFLGQTYCPLIGKYIQDNFIPIAQFGDWTNEPGWAWNHGTLILRRKGI
ncbi:MAG: hypothetical protein HQL14_03725 [Candidatus Omnitrophica bacterium]|nr:hypothetical protein [Candidatus Omnitrophota bacterium]